MKILVNMPSQLIVTCVKDLTDLKYGTLSKWSLYDNFIVNYEWSCPEKKTSRKQEIAFENLPVDIQIMISKKAIKSPLLKTLEDEKQLMLVHLAVMNND